MPYTRKTQRTISFTHASSSASTSTSKTQSSSSSSSSHISSLLQKFEPFQSPPVPTDKSAQSYFLSGYSNLAGFSAKPSLDSSKVSVPNGAIPSVVRPVIINPLSTSSISSYDRGNFATLAELKSSYSDEAINLINQKYLGAGTPQGLLHRLSTQLTTRSSPRLTQEEVDFTISHFPTMYTPLFKGESLNTISPELNPEAHPGAPWFIPGVTVNTEDIASIGAAFATKYIDVLKTEGVSSLIKYSESPDHRHEFVAMLCPKLDVYERAEYFEKVRPFFVFPLSLRFLFTAITDKIFPAIQNFSENPRSCSAFRFTWTSGGAQILLDWISDTTIPGTHFLFWGDDAIYKIVGKDNSVAIFMPDISGMDMHVDDQSILLYYLFLLSTTVQDKSLITLDLATNLEKVKKFLSQSSLDVTWFNVIQFYYQYIKKHNVLTYKSLLFSKMKGVSSGINGTTWIDFMASSRLGCKAEKMTILDTIDPRSLTKWYKEFEEISLLLNLPLKASTLKFQLTNKIHPISNGEVSSVGEILPEDTLIGLKFLGSELKLFTHQAKFTKSGKDITYLVPSNTPIDAAVSSVYTVFQGEGASLRTAKSLAALFGMGFTHFANPDAYDYLAKAYNKKIEQGGNPNVIPDEQPELVDYPLEDCIGCMEYPLKEYFASYYAPPDVRDELIKPDLIKGLKPIGSNGSIGIETTDDVIDLTPNIINDSGSSNLENKEDSDITDIIDTTVTTSTTHVPPNTPVSYPTLVPPSVAAQLEKFHVARPTLAKPKMKLPQLPDRTGGVPGKVPFDIEYRKFKAAEYKKKSREKYLQRIENDQKVKNLLQSYETPDKNYQSTIREEVEGYFDVVAELYEDELAARTLRKEILDEEEEERRYMEYLENNSNAAEKEYFEEVDAALGLRGANALGD